MEVSRTRIMWNKSVIIALFCGVIGLAWTVPSVDAKDAVEGQFPYQVSLKRMNSHYCGGSIISKNYILTAAHCVGTVYGRDYFKYKPEQIKVYAGSTNLLSGGMQFDVAAYQFYQDFESHPDHVFGDIALLKLATPLNFSNTIQPIALESREIPENTTVVTSGWGTSSDSFDFPPQLQWTTLSSISREKCSESEHKDWNSVVCLAHRGNDVMCNGHSGGPTTLDGKLVGVTGFLVDSCFDYLPEGYTKVAYYLDWIRDNSDV